MIRRDALRKTYAAETAASDWWSRLSGEEQQAYKRAHPGSRYAKMSAPTASPGRGSDHGTARTLHDHHLQKWADLTRRGTSSNPKRAARDATMRNHHGEASNHFLRAADLFEAGDKKAGAESMRLGHHHAQKAQETYDAARPAKPAVKNLPHKDRPASHDPGVRAHHEKQMAHHEKMKSHHEARDDGKVGNNSHLSAALNHGWAADAHHRALYSTGKSVTHKHAARRADEQSAKAEAQSRGANAGGGQQRETH